MHEKAYAFIDGNSFEATLNRILTDFTTSIDEIDWHALTKGASRIFYFDALPTRKQDEAVDVFDSKLKAKAKRFSELRRIPNLHVREGVTQSRRNSGATPLEQKGVDIALAVEVLTHVQLENMDVARLFLNDRDFFPLLDALTNTKVRSELYFDPTKTNDQLIESADVAIGLNHYTLSVALPQDKKSHYGITGLTEDISSYTLVNFGHNNFGAVEIVQAPNYENFVLRGKVDSTNACCHMSRCKPLLIDHFEACAKHPVKWANKLPT